MVFVKLRAGFRAGVFFLLTGLLFSLMTGPASAARKSAAMAIDAHTGRTLYSHNIDKPHHPASLTKIMTLYMLFEFIQAGRLDLNSPLQVTANAAGQQPSKIGVKAGSTITVEQAIKALIVKSANDVAVTVAENIAGSEWKFAQLMTWKARQLGMTKTVFRNASGLPDVKQVTTAREMLVLCRRIQQDFPGLFPYFATRTFRYHGKTYKTYNRLMTRTKGVDGIKTGYTRASGFNLTSSYWQGRKHVLAVVMGGKTARRRDAFMGRVLKKVIRKASKGQRKKIYKVARSAYLKKPQMLAAIKKPRELAKKPVQKKQHDLLDKKPVEVAALNRKAPPGLKKLGAALPQKGPFHIQIGAFGSKEDAMVRLESIGTVAGVQLKGHKSFTMQVPDQALYRARFAGFSEQDARKTCKWLKRKSIECLAVPAP